MYLAAALFAVPVLALWLASLPMVQQRIGEYAASWVAERTGTEIEFGRVGVGIAAGGRAGIGRLEVVLTDAHIIDSAGAKVWHSDYFSASLWWPALIVQRVVIPRITLHGAAGHLYRMPESGDLNIDAFADLVSPRAREKRGERPQTRWRVEIGVASFENSEFVLGDLRRGVDSGENDGHRAPSAPSVDRWAFQEVSGTLRELLVAENAVGADLADLSFVLEDRVQGIELPRAEIALDVVAGRGAVRLNDLSVTVGGSSVAGEFALEAASWAAVGERPELLEIDADLQEFRLSRAEVLSLLPEDHGVRRHLELEAPAGQREPLVSARAQIHGSVGALEIPRLEVELGEATRLRATGSLGHLHTWRGGEELRAKLSVQELVLAREDLEILRTAPAGLQRALPATQTLTGEVELEGREASLAMVSSSEYGELSMSAAARLPWPHRLEDDDGRGAAARPEAPNYRVALETERFAVGRLLPEETPLGELSMSAEVTGRGFTREELQAELAVEIPWAELNGVRVSALSAEAQLDANSIAAEVTAADPRLTANGRGTVSLEAGEPAYRAALLLERADLGRLGLLPHNIRVAGELRVDARGRSLDTLTGLFELRDFRAQRGDRVASVSSVELRARNRPDYTQISLSSEIASGVFSSTVPLGELPEVVRGHVRRYFRMPDTVVPVQPDHRFVLLAEATDLQPLLSGFLPELYALSPGRVRLEFNGETNTFHAAARLEELRYGRYELEGFSADASSDAGGLSYRVGSERIAAGAFETRNPLIQGSAFANRLETRFALQDAAERPLVAFGTVIESEERALVARFLSDEALIDGEVWQVPADHEVRIERDRITVHNLRLGTGEQWITARTRLEPDGSEPLVVELSNIALATLGRPVGVSEEQLNGVLNGVVTFRYREPEPLLTADVVLSALQVNEIDLGTVQAELHNRAPGRFEGGFTIAHDENRAEGSGYFVPATRRGRFGAEVSRLGLAYLQAAAGGELTETAGYMSGEFEVFYDGGLEAPVSGTGELAFYDAMVAPRALNTAFYADGESVRVTDRGVSFDRFGLQDARGNRAELDGSVEVAPYHDSPRFDLRVRADRFLALDTEPRHDERFYGQIVVDSDLRLHGDLEDPVIEGSVGLQRGSSVTFVMPERAPSVHEGEGVVRFVDAEEHYSVPRGSAPRSEVSRNGVLETTFDRLDMRVNLEIDPDTRVLVIVDRQSGDRLTLRGGGALSLSVAPGGNITLSGRYAITQGSYDLSFYNIARRRFIIEPGSAVVWTGDPYDAELSIDAVYSVRTSPENLFAAYMPDQQRHAYRGELPFRVVLRMRGRLSEPEIAFELDMPPEERGALAGAVYNRVQQINESEAERNRQAFALIVLNQFIAEDFSGVDQSAALAPGGRSSVARVLTQQLNALSGRILPGTDIRFEVESYEEFTEEGPEGRTEVYVDITQRFLEDRLIVRVGGVVDVEGERRAEGGIADLAGDVAIEYLITEDGRYRVRGFRRTGYEGPVDGTLTSTGVALQYTRQFDRVRELFRRPREDDAPDGESWLDEIELQPMRKHESQRYPRRREGGR